MVESKLNLVLGFSYTKLTSSLHEAYKNELPYTKLTKAGSGSYKGGTRYVYRTPYRNPQQGTEFAGMFLSSLCSRFVCGPDFPGRPRRPKRYPGRLRSALCAFER